MILLTEILSARIARLASKSSIGNDLSTFNEKDRLEQLELMNLSSRFEIFELDEGLYHPPFRYKHRGTDSGPRR